MRSILDFRSGSGRVALVREKLYVPLDYATTRVTCTRIMEVVSFKIAGSKSTLNMSDNVQRYGYDVSPGI
jgi:hypothetical protein